MTDMDEKARRKGAADGRGGGKRSRRATVKKICFASILTLLFFTVLEGVLWIAGVEPAYHGHDPYAGFASNIPHFVTTTNNDGTSVVSVAPSQRDVFNPMSFPASKPGGTYRIICLGGSTTYGRPFFDHTSFAGWLRAFLPEADASRSWEVINAGGISYASYRVKTVMRELGQYEPDLFIVYTGHNEFLERRTYAQVLETPTLVRNAVGLLNRTRVLTSVRRSLQFAGVIDRPGDEKPTIVGDEVTRIPLDAVGPEAYTRDDAFRGEVLAHFETCLVEMVDVARGAGADVLFVTPASNLRHFRPFKSEHADGLSAADLTTWNQAYQESLRLAKASATSAALEAAEKAEAIDPRHATLQYHKGQILLKLKRYDEARDGLIAARDEDVCPLRALSDTVEIVRDVARRRDVKLVDFEALARDRSPFGLPGEPLFADHVHLQPAAHRQLALDIIEALASARIVEPDATWTEETRQAVTREVTASIDRARHAGELRALSAVLAHLGQPASALQRALEVSALEGESPESLYLLGLRTRQLGRARAAADHFRKALAARPQYVDAHFQLGVALAESGDVENAIEHLGRALTIKPELLAAHKRLGVLLAGRGRFAEAVTHFEAVARAQPDSAQAHNNLGLAHAKLRRFGEAITHYRKALALAPNLASVHYNLGLAEQEQGHRAEAIAAFRKVLALMPDHAGARTRLHAAGTNPAK